MFVVYRLCNRCLDRFVMASHSLTEKELNAQLTDEANLRVVLLEDLYANSFFLIFIFHVYYLLYSKYINLQREIVYQECPWCEG